MPQVQRHNWDARSPRKAANKNRIVQRTIRFAWKLRESAHTLSIAHDGDDHGHNRSRGVLDACDLGSKPFANGLPSDPLEASRLEHLSNDPDDEAKPSDRRKTDRD